MFQAAPDVADHRLVGVDVAQAPSEPTAVRVSVAKPALQLALAERVRMSHTHAGSCGKRSGSHYDHSERRLYDIDVYRDQTYKTGGPQLLGVFALRYKKRAGKILRWSCV